MNGAGRDGMSGDQPGSGLAQLGPATDDGPEHSGSLLRKDLTLPATISVVVGGVIGTSIFIIPSPVAQGAGSPLLALGVWVVAGFLTVIAALCLAELSAAIPSSGGPYEFLRRSFRSDLVSYGYAWMSSFVVGPGAIAVVSVICATFIGPYVRAFLGLTNEPTRALATALIVFTTLTNVFGIRVGALTQTVLTTGKVILLLAVILAAFVFLAPQAARVSQAPSPPFSMTLLGGLTSGLLLCVFCFGGAQHLTLVAEEVRRPGPIIPISIIVGMAIVGALYLALNIAIFSTLPFAQVVQSKRITVDLMSAAFGAGGAAFAAGTVFLSGVGVLNTQCMAYPRVLYAFSRDGHFFGALSVIDPRTRTPINSILLNSVVAIVYVFSGSYTQILGYTAFVYQAFMTLTVVAIFVLRRTEPELIRPYKAWGYPWLPGVYVVLSSIYLASLLITQTTVSLIGVVIIAAAIPFYIYFRRRRTSLAA